MVNTKTYVAKRRLDKKTCLLASCGKEFHPLREWQKFCSDPCRREKHRLERDEAYDLLKAKKQESGA